MKSVSDILKVITNINFDLYKDLTLKDDFDLRHVTTIKMNVSL